MKSERKTNKQSVKREINKQTVCEKGEKNKQTVCEKGHKQTNKQSLKREIKQTNKLCEKGVNKVS